MRAQIAQGNAGLAVATYDRLRRRLCDDLGFDPDRGTQEVFAAALTSTERPDEPARGALARASLHRDLWEPDG